MRRPAISGRPKRFNAQASRHTEIKVRCRGRVATESGYDLRMNPPFFEALVDEIGNLPDDLPEWIPCTDSDILRYLPSKAERLRWLRKAKAEVTRRKIQERVDEIAEAWDAEDEILVEVLTAAFPEDLKLHKRLTPSQRQMWLDKAALAACGKGDEFADGEPIVYFISSDADLIKIGFTTNLSSRLRSLRTAHPKELRILLVLRGSRDDEQGLHRRFAEHRVGREWFKSCRAIEEFIARHVCRKEVLLT